MDGGLQLANLEKGKPVARPGRKAMGLLLRSAFAAERSPSRRRIGFRLYSFLGRAEVRIQAAVNCISFPQTESVTLSDFTTRFTGQMNLVRCEVRRGRRTS